MDFTKVTEKNLKYILASRLIEEKCGHACIKKVYDEYKRDGYIQYKKAFVKEFFTNLSNLGVEIVPYWSDDFPSSLKDLHDKPFMLFAKGNIKLLQTTMLCIVGTRRNSLYGAQNVKLLIETLVEKKSSSVATISGLAYGIDTKAHKFSLLYKIPTISVVAGGIDKGFPQGNQFLYNEISQNGLIIAEFPPGVPVVKGMFPMRNRIMAALSKVVVVIEAPVKSGSIITAHIGADLGRDVFAFPGDIYRTTSRGSNNLLSEGAIALNSRNDIIAMINSF